MSLYFYSEKEINEKEESINNYMHLFKEYYSKPPELEEALLQMFLPLKLEEKKETPITLVEDLIQKCNKTISENWNQISKKHKNITKQDAYIICSYTCESKIKDFSPYKILNKNLVSENREEGIEHVSKYLFILLKSLRKLDRYIPSENNTSLYRCIRTHINYKENNSNIKAVPYIKGNTKKFYGFTSTSPDPKLSYEFLKQSPNNEHKFGTVFILTGNIIGYNIHLFNYYKEEEILLEPESKFLIESVCPPVNDIIFINCKILKSPIVLNDEKEENFENSNFIDDEQYKECLCKIKMKVKMKYKNLFINEFGIFCEIPEKHLNALITYSDSIDENFINNQDKLLLFNNKNEEIVINLKANRYKYSIKEYNISIIEILKEDKISNFLKIDKNMKSKNYIDEEILIAKYNINVESVIDKIIDDKNNYYLCSNNNYKEGVVLLNNNKKMIGILMKSEKNNNSIIPFYFIVNKINYIKCVYFIKDSTKPIRILSNGNFHAKTIINGEFKGVDIFEFKFTNLGLYNVIFIFDFCLKSLTNMFLICDSLKEIDLSSLDTTNVKEMNNMFVGCTSLSKINLSVINTGELEEMAAVFSGCSSLKQIDLSSFNTKNVIDMAGLFCGCSSLEQINLSSFDTRNVKYMNNMFYNCSTLKEIDLSHFNTQNLEVIEGFCGYCSSLKKINLSHFDTKNVKVMKYMFFSCSSLEKIDLSSFNTENVYNMDCMICDCMSLKEINLSSFNAKRLISKKGLFFRIPFNCKLICKDSKINEKFNKEKKKNSDVCSTF